ncbi:hypothetical protein AcV7_006038 [Taiwanofungus camphoratus]|nr:hypothetical protein AcV7_006038 [Antrodia cinnamomea]
MHSIAIILVIVYFLLIVSAENLTLADVRRAFYDAKIPQDLNIIFDPTVLLDVAYPEATLDTPGTSFSETLTEPQPIFTLGNPVVPFEQNFVVIMLDLDAPTPQAPVISPIRHFLGGGFEPEGPVPLQSDFVELVSSTLPISSYLSPSPFGTAPHRQSAMFATQTEVTPLTSRFRWNVSDFMQSVELGNPIGGNYMLVGGNI